MKNSKKTILYLILLILTSSIAMTMAEKPQIPNEEANPPLWLKEAGDFLKKGKFNRCITFLEPHLAFPLTIDKENYFHALLIRATAHHYHGSFQKAFADLKEVNTLVNDLDLTKQITAMMRLGDLYLSVGHVEEARNIGQQAVQRARVLDVPDLLAISLNNWGNALMISRQYQLPDKPDDEFFLPPLDAENLVIVKRGLKISPSATNSFASKKTEPQPLASSSIPDIIKIYRESAELARKTDNFPLAIRATINKAKVALVVNNYDLVDQSLQLCKELLKDVPDSFEKGFLQLSLGVLGRQAIAIIPLPNTLDLKLFSWNAFSDAASIGENITNGYIQSYAKGYLGNLYEMDDRVDEAISLTRSAVFFAQQESNPEILYSWQWQLARLLARLGNLEEAIIEYSNAIKTLDKVRTVLTVGYRNVPDIFKDRIKPVYYELAELYLTQATRAPELLDQQNSLKKARNTIETMKSAELEDYFQDECVIAFKAKATTLDNIVPGTAVLYPIVLKDRVILLLTLPDGIQQFSSSIPNEDLNEIIRDFRNHLQDDSSTTFKGQSQRLYSLLIHPIEAQLKESSINTLIIVPDGVLTLIPFSTLLDGETFLAEKYAVVTTPGLQLIDPVPTNRYTMKSLILGVSKPVQGYPALPSVKEEIRIVNHILGGKVFPDEAFTRNRINQELKGTSYGLLHIATHGEFDSDPEKTFILTHDQKLTLNKLEELIKFSKFREDPLELLTLSACQTAVGDERAALGLAGIAVKSGARTVIASLWYVDDEATKELITEFYRQYIYNPELNKAQALQNAQKKLIAMDHFNHPAYWAPFLIIGNWL